MHPAPARVPRIPLQARVRIAQYRLADIVEAVHRVERDLARRLFIRESGLEGYREV